MKLKKDWEIFEEDVAKFVGGKRQAGSGGPVMCKGDIKSEDYLVECKQTSSDFYTLNVKTWEKISNEARNLFRIPLFACRSKCGDYFVMNEYDYPEDFKDIESYEKVEAGDKKGLSINKEFTVKFKGKYTTYNLVCFKVDLKDC